MNSLAVSRVLYMDGKEKSSGKTFDEIAEHFARTASRSKRYHISKKYSNNPPASNGKKAKGNTPNSSRVQSNAITPHPPAAAAALSPQRSTTDQDDVNDDVVSGAYQVFFFKFVNMRIHKESDIQSYPSNPTLSC